MATSIEVFKGSAIDMRIPHSVSEAQEKGSSIPETMVCKIFMWTAWPRIIAAAM